MCKPNLGNPAIPVVPQLEAEIDRLVYVLYWLTEEEIALMEEEIALMEEEIALMEVKKNENINF